MVTSREKLKLLLGITLSEMGGAQKVVHDLISTLPQDRYDITLVTYPGGELIGWVDRLNKSRDEEIKIIGVPSLRREISPWNDLRTFYRLYRIMKKNHYHIAHFHSSKMGVLGRWAAWLARIPRIIFSVHGWGINEYQPLPLRIVLSLVERVSGSLCHHVVCVSQQHLEIGVQNKWMDPDKASVIYNGISPPPNVKGKLRKELKVDENTIIMGTIMRLRTPKDPIFTIQVFHALRKLGLDLKLVIIGDGPLRDDCEKLIQHLAIENQVYLLGTREDARELLNDIDVFTLFTKWEGLPLVIMEAMYAGKAILASNVGGISEIIHHKETGLLINELNLNQAVIMLKDLLDSPKSLEMLGENSRKLALEKFSMSRMSKAYQEIYEDEDLK